MGTENDLPGISLKDEQRQLQNIIGIAQDNLDRAKESVKKLTDDLEDLRDVYEAQDKEGLALWNNATAQLHENERNIVRCEKARKKPYFGRIDFKDPRQESQESYYIGRVGIAKNASEPVVIDWRAPISSVYYESSLGPCKYTVSSEGTFEIDLNRKRTYEIADDKLIDFFDSDVVANDELLTKYLAKNKKAVLGEIIATIQKEQNLIIRRSPKTNIIVQGVAGSGKTTVAMHRISYILYNYADDFRPEDFYIIGSNHILLNYITSVLPELDVYGIKQMTMEQLFTRLLYEDWDDKKYSIHEVSKNDSRNSIKGSKEWFEALEKFCLDYEQVTNKAENEKLDLSAFVKKDRENQTQCTATDMANKIKIKEVSKAAKKSSLPLNPSPYAYGSIPDNDILHVKGHSKGKFAVKWLKKGKSHVEIATADGTLYVIPITPEIVRVIFVKGIGVKPHKTYWKQKADTAFKWVAKESKSLIEIQTEKLILRIEKKNGAIQYFDADRKLLVSENATEPRLLNNGECYTFFDWDKSEKLKSKGILATDLTDLTNKARYISFGGRQQRLPLVVSNKGYGIATASSRTALFCNIKMYGQYIYADGDTQSDYYFIGAGSVGHTLELYGTL